MKHRMRESGEQSGRGCADIDHPPQHQQHDHLAQAVDRGTPTAPIVERFRDEGRCGLAQNGCIA